MFKYPLKNHEIYHNFILSSEDNSQHQNQLLPSTPLPQSSPVLPATDKDNDDDGSSCSEIISDKDKRMKSKLISRHNKKKEIFNSLSKQKKSQEQQQKKKIHKQVKKLTLSEKTKLSKKIPKKISPTLLSKQTKKKEVKEKKKTAIKEKQNNSPPSKVHSATKTLESFSRQFLPAFSSAGKERQRKQEKNQEIK